MERLFSISKNLNLNANYISLSSLSVKLDIELTQLHLDENELSSNGIDIITEFVSNTNACKILSLNDSGIIDGENILRALAMNLSIEEFSISDNFLKVTKETLSTLFLENTTLKHLNLSRTKIPLRFISNLKHNTSLTNFEFAGNRIIQDGFCFFTPTLRSLDLSENLLKPNDIFILIELLKQEEIRLRDLKLLGNNFGEQSEEIFTALKPYVENIFIDFNVTSIIEGVQEM